MGTFLAAYLVIWLALALYVHRLTARQRQIESQLQTLRQQMEESDDRDRAPSSAA